MAHVALKVVAHVALKVAAHVALKVAAHVAFEIIVQRISDVAEDNVSIRPVAHGSSIHATVESGWQAEHNPAPRTRCVCVLERFSVEC